MVSPKKQGIEKRRKTWGNIENKEKTGENSGKQGKIENNLKQEQTEEILLNT